MTATTREYRNEPGHAAPAITDAAAFRVGSSIDSSRARAHGMTAAELPVTGACQANSETLCLQDGRFELTVEWRTLDDERGAGRIARPRTEDSGLFWYFGPLNWEMLVKVVDGTPMNGHFWLCVASATDVGFDLTVRDTVTGMVKSYTKEAGAPARAIMDVRGVPGDAGAVGARQRGRRGFLRCPLRKLERPGGVFESRHRAGLLVGGGGASSVRASAAAASARAPGGTNGPESNRRQRRRGPRPSQHGQGEPRDRDAARGSRGRP